MTLDANPDARSYLLPARQRLDDARALLDAGRTNGCIFLAGFAVECLLKAVILTNSTPRERPELLVRLKEDFGHNVVRLRQEAARRGVHPGEAERSAFRTLTGRENDIRYDARVQSLQIARRVFEAATTLSRWAEGK